MKRLYLTVVLTLTGLLGLGTGAHAQDSSGNRVVVRINFDFVVDGSRIMPAGTYDISRLSQDPRSGLVIRSDNNTALLLPVAVSEGSAEQARLGFRGVGGEYFLTTIETPIGVYTMITPRAITKLAQGRDHGTVSSSGN